MKLTLAFIISFCCSTLLAQQNILNIAKSNRLSNLSLNQPQPQPSNINNMPIGKVGDVTQTFTLNNGSSLDIYKSQPDNMPVVKPDGYYYDNMGIKRLPSKTITDAISAYKANQSQANQFQANGNSKYNFVLPPFQDSLPYLDSTKKLLKIK